jgi:tetratricopeptide (TPR) repeat protein
LFFSSISAGSAVNNPWESQAITMTPKPTIDQVMQAAIRHHQAGRRAQAEKLYQAVLAQAPDHAHAACLMGVLSHENGEPDAAVNLILRAISIRPTEARFHFHLGDVLRDRRRLAEAIAAYRRAIENDDRFFEAYNNLGIALREFGQLDEAISSHHKAIALQPTDARAWNNLGIALSVIEEPDEAILAYQRAIDLNPNYAQAFHNLGKAMALYDRFDEAIASFRRATEIKPDFAAAMGDLSNALKHEGKLAEALDAAAEAASLKPDAADAHCRYGLMLLRTGELQRGWEEYEWRYKISVPWSFPQPRWEGDELRGRTLLLHADQGLGDSVQFIRYAPLIAAGGGRVILRCQRQLTRLLKGFPGVAQTISEDEPLPAFDVHCPLISLPVAFKTSLKNIAGSCPYIRVSASQIRTWSTRIAATDHRLKVGLVWAGHPSHSNDRHRSTTLASLSPLSQCGDIAFYSLQVGAAGVEAADRPAGIKLIDLTPEITDFADTAALIEHLDLVIGVDTSTAHVAAAMGKPVWVVLPFVAEWRWLVGRLDTPWYPTIRLFRQPKLNDWPGAIAQLIEPLRNLAARGIAGHMRPRLQ